MKDGRMKTGIMGGTFDPIHIGHLLVAEHAREELGLDRVLFMPAGNPPHKQHRDGRALNEQRIEMVRLAIRSNPYFELSLMEMNEEGLSYTYQTLEKLTATHPDEDFYFIIGADSLYDFKDWKEPARICACASVVVATRNHTDDDLLDYEMRMAEEWFHGTFIRLHMENIDVSSMQLRRMLEQDRSIRYYVPDDVVDYIEKEKIYQRKEG